MKVFCIGIRRKYIGKSTFESDTDAGNFCFERFYSLKAAIQFMQESEKRLALLRQGSHCPHNPLYLRWSEFQVEFYEVERAYAWHRLDYRKRGKCVRQINFRTAFCTDIEKSTGL